MSETDSIESKDPPEEHPAQPRPGAAERAAEPASIVDGEDHHVDSRVVVVDRIIGLGVTLAVSVPTFVGIGLGWLLGGIPGGLYAWLLLGWLALFGGIALLAYKWPAIEHRHLTYRVDESGLRIRSGVVWRKTASVPTTRVQHTDVSQGPLQRHFELATLTVHTAGTQDASIALTGLEHGVANRLRDHLLPEDRDDAV